MSNWIFDWIFDNYQFVAEVTIGAALAIGLFLIDWRSKKREASREEGFRETTNRLLQDIQNVSGEAKAIALGIKNALETSQLHSFTEPVANQASRTITGAVREFVAQWERFTRMTELDQVYNRVGMQRRALQVADRMISEASNYKEFLDADFHREAMENANLIRTLGEHQIITIGKTPWDELFEKGNLASQRANAFLNYFAERKKTR
jgi:hypothetical protein